MTQMRYSFIANEATRAKRYTINNISFIARHLDGDGRRLCECRQHAHYLRQLVA